MRHSLVLLVLTIVTLLDASTTRAADAFEQNKRLGRGVNVLGYDPVWRDRSRARFKEEHFRLIREAGFNHVRINLHPFRDGGSSADGTLSNRYLQTLDWAVDGALANGLLVVLDFHEYHAMADDPAAKKPLFLAFWRQVAERYRDRPDTLLFELLNEPNGKLTADAWNEYLRDALATVRKTNPTRTVVIGPAFWNNISHLKALELPQGDRNLIVTVHYYAPMEFTHQGASWTNQQDKLDVPWEGTPAERARLTQDFDTARDWANANRRPIYLSEFGAYDKAAMDARVRWTTAVARAAEERGFSWAYWQFESDFNVYDVKKGQWVKPIRDSLLPPGQRTVDPR